MRVTVIATGFDQAKNEHTAPAVGAFTGAAEKAKSSAPASSPRPVTRTNEVDDIDEIFKIFNR